MIFLCKKPNFEQIKILHNFTYEIHVTIMVFVSDTHFDLKMCTGYIYNIIQVITTHLDIK